LSADGARGLLSVAAVSRMATAIPASLRLPGLQPETLYELALQAPWGPPEQTGKRAGVLHRPDGALTLPGRAWATTGLSLPLLHPGTGAMWRLRRCA
jgi:hypothetical protein